MSQEWLPAATRDARTAARYWAKVHRLDDGCWLWTGAISGRGHGRFWVAQGQCAIAHRFGWALAVAGQDVDDDAAARAKDVQCRGSVGRVKSMACPESDTQGAFGHTVSPQTS